LLLSNGYVINLNTRSDRWERMSKQLERFELGHFERYPAISAQSFDIKDLPENFVKTISGKLKKDIEKDNVEYCVKAAWGCLQSHLGIISMASEKGLLSVVVLEDDCEIEPHFKKIMQKLEVQLQDVAWDVIYLGGNLHRKSKVRKINKNILKGHGITLTHGMIISHSVYRKILDEAPTSGVSIDDYYRKILQPKINCLLVDPQIAYQFYTDISDISLSKKIFKLNFSNLKRMIYRKINRFLY